MNVTAIIQARMASTRLPGKVLADIAGRPMLARVCDRVERAETVDRVVVATGDGSSDEPIVECCRQLGVACFRGSEADVLDRFDRAAREFNAQVVVRITADCPLIDPGVIDEVVRRFLNDEIRMTNDEVRPSDLVMRHSSFERAEEGHAGDAGGGQSPFRGSANTRGKTCPARKGDSPQADFVIRHSSFVLPHDYASNTLRRTWPRGLDTEVIAADALADANRRASDPYERAHVTPYIYQHPRRFRLLSVTGREDCSHRRWTVDEPADLELIRAVYERLAALAAFGWEDVRQVLDGEPVLNELNRHVRQKELTEG